MKTGAEFPGYDFSKGLRGKYVRRYAERPSIWHIIVTCVALVYLLAFIQGWVVLLGSPKDGISFWTIWIAFGLGLAWIANFLIQELIRQFRLYRQRKSP